MKSYIGTKKVEAEPMKLGEFIKKTGKDPYSYDGFYHGREEEGYLMQYEEGYLVIDHLGNESWSSKADFEKEYKA